MAIRVLFLLLACIAITTTTTTNFTSSHTSTSTIAFNAKIGLVEKQTNLADERKSWKSKVVHRDRIHSSSFQQRMKCDAKRVANLIHQLDEDGVYYHEVEHFKEDEGSDLGSVEYFIPIGFGTPPTPQYLVIDTRSDIGWVQCQPCVQCPHLSQHLFDPTHSSSFLEIPCNSYVCNLL
ncbi:protein ASPARTIC PROTEASE IN GUARD CELL 2-like [Quercus lobata]|uniref:protein ASPARTIC PROTEASE IN GUARD CELL 2-like n=1 Tax=Quercus lobata TaxID=97700 RepID=UPI001243ACEE|nr:protein ASPARTIC PROTEASE IN GUARD CELL 2-like [Quercus lobata]